MKKILLFGFMLSFAHFAIANKHIEGSVSNASSQGGGKTGVFDCNPSTSQIDLDINNVRARILGGGDMWWDGVETAQYEVPKIDAASGSTPINALFAGALWFTGLDNGGNLKCAAQTYRNQGHDFYTGPLSGNFGEVSFDVCETYDEHFKVYGTDIANFRAAFEANDGSITNAEILALKIQGDPNSDPLQIIRWPGKGNPYYLNNETDKYFNESSLAPFFDFDGNGIYDPTQGDFPVIGVRDGQGNVQDNYADQMIFWVINDNGQIHGRTGGSPMGVQVNCLAFAFQTADALNDMTFYTFEIIKKSPNPLFETYMGVFVDPDLGDFNDDYVGCDTVRDIGFVYNSNAIDQQYGVPPILAIDYFEGPLDDNGNQLGLSSFCYFINGGPPSREDPDDAPEFRNYQTSRWKNGDPFGFDNCTGAAGPATDYLLPGDPCEPSQWSGAQTSCLTGQDFRFVQNSGPFTLQPGDPQRITIGVITVFPDVYDGTPCIDDEIGLADDLAQNLFDNNFDIIDGPDAPTLRIRELSNELVINMINEPSSNNFGESYAENHALPDNGVASNDSLYRFQGYVLYQLRDEKVTAQDLDDPDQARIILQCDIKDGVSNIYNYNLNGVGTYNADLMVQGSDEGITKTVVVKEDLFATGEKALVNNRKYYYAAISYAYADYNPNPVIATYPPLEIFKQGRGNFKTYSAIPHVIDTRNSGTVLNSSAGDAIQVYRYEGRGNGGSVIDISENSINEVLQPPFYIDDVLEYELGKDPISATIIDPLKVQNVDFELRFESYDYVLDPVGGVDSIYVLSNTFADSSFWYLFVYNENGTPIDTIAANTEFNREYVQVVDEYGISLKVNIPEPQQANLLNDAPVYGVLTSSITFEDPTKQWLSFIKDDGFNSPYNWIRSGDGEAQDIQLLNIFDSHQYDGAGVISSEFYDPVDADGGTIFETSILDGQIAPYALASNYANPSVGNPPVVIEGRPEYLFGPAFRWDVWDVSGTNEVYNPINTLDELQSVKIVITENADLWSDCVVFETGEVPANTVSNVPKGAMRANNGVPQMAKFPGYAINLETGERLNIAFGESSELSFYNGADFLWNPTHDLEDINTPIPGLDAANYRYPIWGGKHHIYVFNTRYDNGAAAFDVLSNNTINTNPNASIPTPIADLYSDIMYTCMPVLSDPQYAFVNPSNLPSTVTININIDRPYENFVTEETTTPETNNGMPRYRFSTIGLAPEENVTDVAESALDNIRVVPNPYYAFSAYEENQIENVVKIIGLPDKCKVRIYTLDGKLVRQYDRAVGNASNTDGLRQEIADGQPANTGINIDNSISWDLNNYQRIPIGSGTYIIHVDAFELGEKTVKAAIFMRPTDVSNF